MKEFCPECGAFFGRGTRSDQQRKAIEVYCNKVAKALNEAGYDIRLFFQDELEVPWSQPTVKELIWRRIQRALKDKESTTELNKIEVSEVFEVINNNLAEKGIHVPFPRDEAGGNW